jgi:hypothetical protein
VSYSLHLIAVKLWADGRYGTSEAEQVKAPTAGPSESKGFMAFR